MKVHYYGNDYAFQRQQKNEIKSKTKSQPVNKSQKPIDDVENQLPAGGRTEVATHATEATSKPHQEQAPTQKKRKKKEKNIDSEQESSKGSL